MSALEAVGTVPAAGCRCVRISRDGTSVLTLSAGIVQVCDALTGQPGWSRHWDTPEELPAEAAWGAEGDTVTLLTGGKLAQLDAMTGESLPLPAELADRAGVSALALSPRGRAIAVGTREGIVLLWQLHTARVDRLHGGGDPVTALAWRPDGSELCVARPRAVQFWHMASGTMISSIDASDTRPLRLAWAPGGDLVTVAGLRDIRAISVAARRECTRPLALGGKPSGLEFSRTGALLLAGMPDGSLRILDRQLMPAGLADVIPAALTEPSCLHVNETGLAAARVDPATVTVARLPDTLLPTAGQRTSAALGRWAAGVVRAAGGSSQEEPAPPVPSTVATRSWFAWADDGWYLADRDSGAVTRYAADGQPRWTGRAGPGPLTVEGRLVASPGPDGQITVLDAADGNLLAEVAAAGQPSLYQGVLAVTAPGGHDLHVYPPPWTSSQVVPAPEGVGDPAWSPGGTTLAAASADAIALWDGQTLRRIRQLPAGQAARPGAVCWSPDGGYLAALRPGGQVTVWDTRSLLPGDALTRSTAATGVTALAWAPGSRVLAVPAPAPTGAVKLWDIRRDEIVLTVPPPPSGGRPVAAIAWAADGRFAVTHDDGTVVRWELTLPPSPGDEPVALPHAAPVLSSLAAAAAAVGSMAGLPLLADLLSLLLREPAGRLAELDGHRGVALLRGLRWPPGAVVGLAVLVAVGLPGSEELAPPDGAVREDMRAALEQALDGATIVPRPYQPPVAALAAELERIDDSVLFLAELLGPDAVAAEPGLLARVRRQSFSGWSLALRQRRLLGLRTLLRPDGSSQGLGIGDTRAGFARTGQLPALLPSQLALPAPVFAARRSRDELLYRTRLGELPLAPQGVVLLLDDTPAACGAVGVTARLMTTLLAGMAIRRNRRCALIRLSSPDITFLTDAADLVHLWSASSVGTADLETAMTSAQRAAAQLSDPVDGLPRRVLLTHPYLSCPSAPDLHVVRVHYPGIPAEDFTARTHVISPTAGPEELYQVIGEILSSS